ncbi:MAG: phytoene/squalene synthase family protein [Methylobacterium mesophilicum]|nr:phytoene/squalene synthase family protein [Methylobacterium mesophilicum]
MDTAELADLVRGQDADRHLVTLYAPESKRRALLALHAFYLDVAAIRSRVREPLPGEIRLQWWRDAILNGEAGGHPVAEVLIETIRAHDLPVSAFDDHLEARIFDLYADPFEDRNALEGYCGETEGALLQLAALVVDPASARQTGSIAGHGGCALGILRILNSLAAARARGQCPLPRDMLSAVGTTPAQVTGGDDPRKNEAAVEAMIALGRDHLAKFAREAHAMPASVRPAFLLLASAPAQFERIELDAYVRQPNDAPAWRRQFAILRRAMRGW